MFVHKTGRKMALYAGTKCAWSFAWEGKKFCFWLGAKKKVCTGEKKHSPPTYHLVRPLGCVLWRCHCHYRRRSFSAVRQIKTYLRSSVTQQRLNNVMLMNVHKDLTDALDLVNILGGSLIVGACPSCPCMSMITEVGICVLTNCAVSASLAIINSTMRARSGDWDTQL